MQCRACGIQGAISRWCCEDLPVFCDRCNKLHQLMVHRNGQQELFNDNEPTKRSVDTDGIRHWCNSVEQEFSPREQVPRGESQRQIPEAFLACSIRYLRALADELDERKS